MVSGWHFHAWGPGGRDNEQADPNLGRLGGRLGVQPRAGALWRGRVPRGVMASMTPQAGQRA